MATKLLARIAVVAIIGLGSGFGQQTAPRPTVPTNPNPTPTPTPSPIPGRTTNPNIPSTSPNDRSPFPSEMPRPIFLSGRVLLSDGTVPTEQVVVERICGTRVIPEGYTDSKGRFSFELGHNRMTMMDASTDMDPGWDRQNSNSRNSPQMPGQSGVTERSLMGCELRASLPGFRSETVNLSNRRSMDNPDVGTIYLRRMANVEGLTISATTLQAPKDARKAEEKGREALGKGKFDEAAKHLDKAVQLYPGFAMAWYERGRVYEAQNQLEEARKAFDQAIKADPKLITPYDRLAILAIQTRNWQEAANASESVMRLNPVDFPQAYLFNAVANLNLRNLDVAEKSAAKLLDMDPGHKMPKAEHIMGVILALRADWENSAAHFRKFIETAKPGSDGVEQAKKQLAEVEKTLAAQKQN